MKKISSIFAVCFTISILIFGCKTDKTPEKKEAEKKESLVVRSETPTISGEFIHVDTAAVLKVNNKLYGVKMDDIAKSVIGEAEKLKTDDYDVINVIVKGEIMPNPEPEGWKEIIKIKSLDKIYKPEPRQETKVLNSNSKKTQ